MAGPGLAGPFVRGCLVMDVSTDAPGARPQLVGQPRRARGPSTRDGRRLSEGSTPHVFGILALGRGSSAAVAKLGGGVFRHRPKNWPFEKGTEKPH